MTATLDAVKPRCGDRNEEIGDIDSCVQKKTALCGRFRSYQFTGAQTRQHGSLEQKILQK
jgi:hypothetical protein